MLVISCNNELDNVNKGKDDSILLLVGVRNFLRQYSNLNESSMVTSYLTNVAVVNESTIKKIKTEGI